MYQKLMIRVLDRRYWTSTVNPPQLAPPPGAQRPQQPQQSSFSSSMASKMGDLSLGKDSTGGSGTSGKKDGEKKEKKSLFKMKW